MKNLMLILTIVLTSFLSGCVSTPEGLIHTTNILATYKRMEFQHPKIVERVKDNKDVFTTEERELLKEQLFIIEGVRAQVKALEGKDKDVLGAMSLQVPLSDIRSAFAMTITILEGKMEALPLTLQYRLKQQISDAKSIDASIQALLKDGNGVSHVETLKSVTQLISTVAKLAVLF